MNFIVIALIKMRLILLASIDEIGLICISSLAGLMDMRIGYNHVIIQQDRARGLIPDKNRL